MLDQRPEAPPEPEVEPAGRWAELRSRVTAVQIAVFVAFAVPLLAWAWRIVGFGNRFQYWSDSANNELSSLDVGSHFVAIGSYSRKVWSHPGPLGFYLLAIPAHLSRQNSIGLALGVLALNTATMAGILYLAHRRGGAPLFAVTAALLAVFVHALGPGYLVEVWHPSLPVLPFTLLLFLCWNVASGERWSLPVAVAVATFCIQEHVGYVAVASAVLLGAIGLGFGSSLFGPGEERRDRLVAWLRPTLAAVLVGLVLWAPPIVEEIRGEPGNLTLIGAYFRDNDGEKPAGLEFGVNRQGTALGYRPTWAIGEAPALLTFRSDWYPNPNPPVAVIALAIGAVFAVRRRDRHGIMGAAVAGGAVVTGIIAGSRITGMPFFYLTRWTMAIGWFTTLVALWLLLEALIDWRPKVRQAVVPVSLAVLAVMSLLFTSNVVHQSNPQDPWGPIADELAREVKANLPEGSGPVQFRRNLSYQAMAHRSALITSLERDGIETSVENVNPITHGKWRTGFAENPRVTLLVAADDQIEDFLAKPGYRLIAESRPQTPAEARETAEYRKEVSERVMAGESVSWNELRRVGRMGELHPMAVFVVPEKSN